MIQMRCVSQCFFDNFSRFSGRQVTLSEGGGPGLLTWVVPIGALGNTCASLRYEGDGDDDQGHQ